MPAADAVSARHRTGVTPPAEGEVELAGPRVVASDNRIVALWDPWLRYRPGKAGYHGGASLAEVTIPLLAFLLPNVSDPPAGWAPIEGRQPDWWQLHGTTPVTTPAVPPTRATPAKSRRKPTVATGEALFEVPAPSVTVTAPGSGGLVAAVLASELFQAQHGTTPRKLAIGKLAAAACSVEWSRT